MVGQIRIDCVVPLLPPGHESEKLRAALDIEQDVERLLGENVATRRAVQGSCMFTLFPADQVAGDTEDATFAVPVQLYMPRTLGMCDEIMTVVAERLKQLILVIDCGHRAISITLIYTEPSRYYPAPDPAV